MKSLYLNPGGEKRILRGHKWIFSNEIEDALNQYEPGSWVQVFSHKKKTLGFGYINPRSLIAVRLVAGPGKEPGTDVIAHRMREASQWRKTRIYPGAQCYRVVYGESDGLPGLVVDRYGKLVVYQITTLGMSLLESEIREAIHEVLQPETLVYRHDSPVRLLEGLPLTKGVAYGEVPEVCSVELDGIRFVLNPIDGQKTGMYLDQRDNRQALKPFVHGKKILDLFCYNGAWSLTAAAAGAVETLGIDESKNAIESAKINAHENGFAPICRFEAREVFHALKELSRNTFDVVVVDPPAFVKNKSALAEAKKGYTDLNRRAMMMVKPGGVLISCSCSYHLDEASFKDVLLKAAQAGGRELKLLEARGQAKDHPVLLAMPETNYLKCYVLQVV